MFQDRSKCLIYICSSLAVSPKGLIQGCKSDKKLPQNTKQIIINSNKKKTNKKKTPTTAKKQKQTKPKQNEEKQSKIKKPVTLDICEKR